MVMGDLITLKFSGFTPGPGERARLQQHLWPVYLHAPSTSSVVGRVDHTSRGYRASLAVHSPVFNVEVEASAADASAACSRAAEKVVQKIGEWREERFAESPYPRYSEHYLPRLTQWHSQSAMMTLPALLFAGSLVSAAAVLLFAFQLLS